MKDMAGNSNHCRLERNEGAGKIENISVLAGGRENRNSIKGVIYKEKYRENYSRPEREGEGEIRR